MNTFRKIAILLIALLSITSVDAITLNSSGMNELQNKNIQIDISGGSNLLTLEYEYSIFVDGDLYLDYSVFNHNQSSIFIDSVIKLNSSGVSIFSYDQEPKMPDLLATTIFQNLDLTMNEFGNVLLYSDTPIRNGAFEATKHIYIGNYSAIQAVPLPASFILFLTGLGMLIGKMSLTKYVS